MLGAKEGSVISDLMRNMDLTSKLQNPPFANRIPSKLVYIRQYGLDMAYVSPSRQVKQGNVLRMTNNASVPGEPRIVRKFPGDDWKAYGKTYKPAAFLTQQNQDGMPRYMTSFPPMTVWPPSG